MGSYIGAARRWVGARLLPMHASHRAHLCFIRGLGGFLATSSRLLTIETQHSCQQ